MRESARSRRDEVSERELLVELKRALTIALRAIEKRLETVKDTQQAA